MDEAATGRGAIAAGTGNATKSVADVLLAPAQASAESFHVLAAMRRHRAFTNLATADVTAALLGSFALLSR